MERLLEKWGEYMKTLLENGTVVNVFTGELQRANVLIGDGRILGVGAYAASDADRVEDVGGRYLCPGFIDGHIHIESTMLLPAEFARVCVAHGTTTVVTDPHEIANVCGMAGIEYMLRASEGLPLTVYVMLPSCVPATPFDESGARLAAADLEPLYAHPRVHGLAEVMDYPGVVAGAPGVMDKIAAARERGLTVNGHAPLLSGRALDRYIAAGIRDDHECSSADEAKERIRKGQRVMIRQGTAARNLEALLPLFEEPWAGRCLLVTDDKHPADLLAGHIDESIRLAVRAGKSPLTGIRMATLGAAEALRLPEVGALAPGYTADLLVLDDLDEVAVRDVYRGGTLVARGGRALDFEIPPLPRELDCAVRDTVRLDPLTAEAFALPPAAGGRCRVIRLVPGQLLTEEWLTDLPLCSGGVDVSRDILKIAVLERHRYTGHRGLGLIAGIGLRHGAIASTVAHDSHNLIVIGENDRDMAVAANRLRELGGGCLVVDRGEVVCEMPLPVAGLMSDGTAAAVAEQNERLRASVHALGVPAGREPFMTMAFVSLPVIPHLKITTLGLVDVDNQRLVPLFPDA